MKNASPVEQPDSQTLLNQIVVEFMRERKSNRRWRWFKRIVGLLLILFFIYMIADFSDEAKGGTKPHIGLVDISGTIFDTQSANADNFAKGLESAYKNQGLQALIVRINSPGGSPVQADYMYNLLKYYKKTYPKVNIYAVCVDICASAAYYVAAAADKIYADESSMVGSIGVIYNGFGFVDAMQKLGISRRLQTAGTNKAFLDPFSPTTPEQQSLLQTMLTEIHQIFISRVKQGRGDRLKIDDQIFSGLFWTGQQSLDKGLIDGFASSGQLARDLKLDIVDYSFKPTMFEKLSKNLGTAMVDQLFFALAPSKFTS
jgi:protease-4